jgi:cholesterol transport system auxiliary component
MRIFPAFAIASLALGALGGCSAITALSGGPRLDVFELLPHDDAPRSCRAGRRAELVIEAPKTRTTLDSDRIMVRPSALQTQYLPDAKWGDTVPVTLQTLLVRGFGRYDVFSHVGRVPLGVAGDYALISEINDFNAEVGPQGMQVRLAVDAQLVRESDARVVARGKFTALQPAGSAATADLVTAFDRAGQDLVAQITSWGLRGIGVNPLNCR